MVRISALAVVTLLSVGTAEAKGCIKGAIIGGIAGHYLAEPGVVGAVAGCLAGRAWRTEGATGDRLAPAFSPAVSARAPLGPTAPRLSPLI